MENGFKISTQNFKNQVFWYLGSFLRSFARIRNMERNDLLEEPMV